jgi:predicted RNase H-like HicB family nuclease
MRDFELTVVIERDEDGRFLAVCPALQGCYTEGDSEDEARTLIADAIRLHIESRLERGEPIPDEVSTEKVTVSV